METICSLVLQHELFLSYKQNNLQDNRTIKPKIYEGQLISGPLNITNPNKTSQDAL